MSEQKEYIVVEKYKHDDGKEYVVEMMIRKGESARDIVRQLMCCDMTPEEQEETRESTMKQIETEKIVSMSDGQDHEDIILWTWYNGVWKMTLETLIGPNGFQSVWLP